MARIFLLDSKRAKPNTQVPAHRVAASEGESAQRLLEDQGFPIKRKANNQFELRCPFHEGSGDLERGKGTNFYLHAETSVYQCHAASCGERGNLQTLERFFGVDEDDTWVSAFRSREEKLKEYERGLSKALRVPFYQHGLTDQTIERFRLGFQPAHVTKDGVRIGDRYIIPYLEGRRPKMFRYYQPDTGQKNYNGRWKYTWEDGSTATLFNGQDAMGDKHGRVFLCEGELKAMLLVQIGYAAVAVPGAGQWKDEFQAAFTHARQIYVCYDNDNPEHHKYDKPDHPCGKCRGKELPACAGHNPGQDAALSRVEQLGWRAKNVLLPPPGEDQRKTDLNDYFMRDKFTNADFAELATGKRATPFRVQSFAEISASPPVEAVFLIEQGILPKGGRLLVAGKPKVGKSIFVDNLALSLSAGIPFLKQFRVDHPTRTLLLDREMSKWSLFERINALIDGRGGYKAAIENLLIDHDHMLRLDQTNAYDTLLQLVEQNGAEVIILDTAYKFFGGDVESSSSLMKGFAVLDKIIADTDCSVVLTHHLRKGNAKGKENSDVVDPDAVVGSFLWTGWPNATILLNYLNRSVENPYNSTATFTAFRDAAAPEPLALYRSRESISYSAIEAWSHEDIDSAPRATTRPTTEAVSSMLLEMCPTTEDDFLHVASARFGVSINTVKPFYLDAISTGHFEKSKGRPPILTFKYEDEHMETWEHEHHQPERPVPDNLGAGYDLDLFDAASSLG